MDRIRWWLLALTAWLFFIYSIERISEPLNLASFVYLLVFGLAAALIAFPRLNRRSPYFLALVVLAAYFILKVVLDYPIVTGSGLPVTITEIVAILGTGFLVRQIMIRLDATLEAVARLSLPMPRESISFEIAQGLMYREIRRARRHHRSASLLAISPTSASVAYSLDRFFAEALRAVADRYVDARLAHFLVEELDDYNIVAQQNGSFLVLLPEASAEEAGEIAFRLQRAAAERLGLHLRIGRAHFPQDAVTFDQLLADAERQMAEDGAAPEHPAQAESPAAEDQRVVHI